MKIRELLEDTDSQLNNVLQNCKQNIADMVLGRKYLFRGITEYSKIAVKYNFQPFRIPNFGVRVQYAIHNKRNTDRISLTGYDFWLQYTASSPDWAAVPKRTRSIFCTDIKDTAEEFGQLGLVIPFDNVDCFASMKYDFNELELGKNRTTALHQRMENVARDLVASTADVEENVNDELSQKFKKAFLNAVKEYNSAKANDFRAIILLLDKILIAEKLLPPGITDSWNYELTHFSRYLKHLKSDMEGLSVSSWIKSYVNPKSMGVTVSKSLISIPDHQEEIWFEGDAVIVKIEPEDVRPFLIAASKQLSD